MWKIKISFYFRGSVGVSSLIETKTGPDLEASMPDMLTNLRDWAPILIGLFAIWACLEAAIRFSKPGDRSRLLSMAQLILIKKKCPKCEQIVRLDASSCKHCGSEIPPGK